MEFLENNKKELKKEFKKLLNAQAEENKKEQLKKDLLYNNKYNEAKEITKDLIIDNIKVNVIKNNICNLASCYYETIIFNIIKNKYFNKNIGKKTLEKMSIESSEMINNYFNLNDKINGKDIKIKISYNLETWISTKLRIYIYYLIDGYSCGTHTDIQDFTIYDFIENKEKLNFYKTYKAELIPENQAIKLYNNYIKSLNKINKLKEDIKAVKDEFKQNIYNNTYNIYEFKDITEKIEI